MYEIADMLDFTELMQFRLVSKSFNWVATRRPLLKKFRKLRENIKNLQWQEFDSEPKQLKNSKTEKKLIIFDLAKDGVENETSRAPQQATIIEMEGIGPSGFLKNLEPPMSSF